jgi:hypothetical protein
MTESQQTNQPIDIKDLEIGFYCGVACALDRGLEYKTIFNDRDDLLETIKEEMEKICSDEIESGKETRPIWSSWSVRHAAEIITTFFICWLNDGETMTIDKIKKFLRTFRDCSNCCSHV